MIFVGDHFREDGDWIWTSFCSVEKYLLGIVADGERHEYLFSPAIAKRLIGVAGREFEFDITCRAPSAVISPPLVTIETAI